MNFIKYITKAFAAAILVSGLLIGQVTYALGDTTNIVGDVDNSGSVNSIDLYALRLYLLEIQEPANIKNGDVNGDGDVNSLDFILMRRKMLGKLEYFPAEIKTVVGDVDNNGKFNSIDLYALRLYLLGIQEPANIKNGDVNGDSAVNSLDFILMRRKILGKIEYFPVEKP